MGHRSSMPQYTADGLSLFYIDESPEPGTDRNEPIILVHGFASSHAVNWVFPQWVKTLTADGRRVIAPDIRGHGRSAKLYDSDLYTTQRMAADVGALADHLGLGRIDLMGFSMGARIAAFLAHDRPALVRSLVLGGLGWHLVEGNGLPIGIADALEAPSLEGVTDPMQRMFRTFAEATKSDLRALAAAMRGMRQTLPAEDVRRIDIPTLVAVGTEDDVAGDPEALASLFPRGRHLDIPGRDHNRSVGDKVYKDGVLAFLAERP